MANVTYTFVAGTKAQASQVNKNFQDCINGINQNASDIAQNASDISSLQTGKANKNGSGSETFSVANPTSSNQAVNKQTLENAITPVLDYINGLIITKSSNTEIAISAGSCYDTTKAQVLVLSSSYTASYSGTLSASTTYDVFIRKSKSTSSVDCAILSHEAEPSSSDYYYRKLGEVVTDGDTYISAITSYSNSNTNFIPDYTNRISKTSGTQYTATQKGLIVVQTANGGNPASCSITVNGVLVEGAKVDSGSGTFNKWLSVSALVKAGDTYTGTVTTGGSIYFYPIN